MKVKKYISSLIISLTVMSYMSSCIDDKGNYDYDKVSEITMEYPSGKPFDQTYEIEFNDSLIIDPQIKISEGIGKDNYYYEWYLAEHNDYNGNIEAHQLSNSDKTSVLRIVLPEKMRISKKHIVIFKAINSVTGLKYTKSFEVTVKDQLQTGYLALSEKDTGIELDIIASFKKDEVEELTLHTNVLQTKNSTFPREGRKPIGIYMFDDIFAPSPTDTNRLRIKYSVYLLTDKNTDRVKPEDYSFKEGSYNIRQLCYIPAQYEPREYIAKKIAVRNNTNYYAYMDGNWFFMNLSPTAIFFMLPINMYKGETTTYKTPPFIANTHRGAIIFNEKDNCFMIHKYSTMDIFNSKNLFQTVKIADSSDDAFQFNNPNYELVYLSNVYNVNPNTKYTDVFAIVKDRTTGNYELLTFSMTSSANIVKNSKSRKIIPNTINMPDVKYYSYHPTEPILYMATEDRVYRILTTTSSIDVKDITSEVVPAGEKVSCIKNMYNHDTKEKRRPLLAIATYKASGSLDTAGTIKMYEINIQNGDLVLAKHPEEPAKNGYQINMEWTGLGKVVDISYKSK